MKKNLKFLILLSLIVSIFSCKKKYDAEYIGPQGKEEVTFQLTDSLKTNGNDTADFSLSIPFFFKAKFDKSITWKLTIVGDSSGAVKTFIGTSSQLDSLTALWKGQQDSLYYFTNETCKVTLSDYYPVTNNSVYNSLVKNSTITSPSIKLTTSISIKIKNPKPLDPNAVEIFEVKRSSGINRGYVVAYDSEACSAYASVEADPDVLVGGSPRALSKAYLPLSRGGGPINRRSKNLASDNFYYNSPYYFVLKGKDTYNNDYYIGRIERSAQAGALGVFLNDHPNLKPEDVWFNVFIYGYADGAKCNFTVKEDDDATTGFQTKGQKPCNPTKEQLDALKYDGKNDDAFERAITLDFTGWKLFSFRYTDFTVIKDGINGNGSGEYNPNKINSIQFSLVAPQPGGSGHVVFDYPVMTIGGPLKY